MNHYIPRSLELILQKAVKQFPAVILTGPRQGGKITLLKKLFSRSHQYLSLETRRRAIGYTARDSRCGILARKIPRFFGWSESTLFQQ